MANDHPDESPTSWRIIAAVIVIAGFALTWFLVSTLAMGSSISDALGEAVGVALGFGVAFSVIGAVLDARRRPEPGSAVDDHRGDPV